MRLLIPALAFLHLLSPAPVAVSFSISLSSTIPTDVYLRHLETSTRKERVRFRRGRYCKDWGEYRPARKSPLVQEHVLSTKLKIPTVTRKEQSATSESGTFRLERNLPLNFTHIGGYDEVKEELLQCVHFMNHPQLYQQYNVRLPRGILLHGPPGTGKTLFARCLAGEANTSFVATSGSAFHQRYVGVGSERVRELFEFSRKHSPCIIFIDEIDAVGRKRSGDEQASQAERDTTVNQLLTEIDGFSQSDRVMLVAATNRPDILDEALSRSGRIDKSITVGLPDAKTRAAIVAIHGHKKPINVSVEFLVDITSGLSGADIESLLNEVTLHGIRKNTLPINETQIEAFHEHLLVGRSVVRSEVSDVVLRRVSVHEIGHALVSLYMEHHGKVRKITVASSAAGTPGYTVFDAGTSTDDLPTKEYLEERMCVLLGGRAAEDVVFGSDHVSTGAVQDLNQCRDITESMLSYGFGSRIIYPRLGLATREAMDADVEFLVSSAYKRALRIIEKNLEVLNMLAELLVDKKTLRYQDLVELLSD